MADGPRYFRVAPRFWDDAASWTDDAKLLALYLLTCPHRTSEGLFRMPKAYAREDMEWSPERFEEAFRELLEVGFIRYDETARVVLIRKALKYQAPANDNMAKAALAKLDDLPETHLWREFRLLAEQYAEQLAERLRERYGEPPTQALPPPQAQGDDADASPPADPPDPPGDEPAQQTHPRKRDEVFEALIDECGWNLDELTKSARGRVNKAAKELREVGASVEGIRARAEVHRRKWPDAELTPTSLAANYSHLGASVGQKRRVGADGELKAVMG